MQHLAWRDEGTGLLGGVEIGETVCGWTIESSLGAGPVSASWLASRDGRHAVVRVLREPFASDDAARVEWVRGAWAANRFHHGRVLEVLDQGTTRDGAPVVVREWAEGESLERVVQRHGVDVARALRVTEQLLDALEMAHAHGILHAALSPANVIVTPRGSVRVVDFAAPPGLLARRSGASSLALAAARVGPFVAPERRVEPAAPPTELSDVWSAGACLCFALTGRAPSPDGSATPAAGADLAAIVSLATAQDPAGRYESAYAMLGDVRRMLAGRRPRLDGALGPVPSQRTHALVPGPSGLFAAPIDAAPSTAPAPSRERLGNALLLLAIAVLVGLATFVVVRERAADAPLVDQPSARPEGVRTPTRPPTGPSSAP